MKHMTDYESDLHEWLKSPENAAAYPNYTLLFLSIADDF